MIDFFSENSFILDQEDQVSNWIRSVIVSEKHELGDVSYIFCDDAYLHKLNVDFLDHDTLTDIISFDYSLGKQVHGEIYISTERVFENASTYNTDFTNELHRVMIHGVLHYCGFKDKTENDSVLMRIKENEALTARIFL